MTCFGIIDTNNTTAVVDKSKIKRERAKARAMVSAASLEKNRRPKCLLFDRKKDATQVQEQREGRLYPVTVREDHYCIVGPDGSFVGHITVPKQEVPGKEAQRILFEMITYFEQNKICLDNLVALGCDGTAVNTGVHGGIVRRMEKYLSRPLQRIICLLYGNELPFRHLFKYIDGETTGPTSFMGEIGKILPVCHTFPLVTFDIIRVNDFPAISESILKDLSEDQRYLYEISSLVSGTAGDESVVKRLPGPIAHSRWLTCACRILRLYISTNKTESYYSKIHSLAEFIVKC